MNVTVRLSFWIACACLPPFAGMAVTSEYAALRAELRAFYPDECHAPCKLAAQTNSVQAIARGIDAFVAAHPERHWNIIVKVCGFSARFVTLSKRWQDEIIARHRLR